MNELIKELAEQANWWKPLGLPSDWNEGDYVVSPEQMEKFAFLIARKCINIVDTLPNGYKDYRNAIENVFRVDCIKAIEKHFGVEY